ncbi:hypothetical protein OGAPHI_005715 [Ogataea philodendri]|uniref:Uncharacterized protein n=1 Tax=Ogataea philodendri TaxID=1378263 RepID=A0A9P8T163_9ASCO|nr:uncharacterized protein OGAPHI_005715 [Ogataea philodendri]KAH3662463.1 hypothetical protein OGAPHI_005715 [Ogataea philodendri]
MTTKAPLASRWADDSDAVVAAVKQDKKIPKHRFAQKPVSRETNSRESENTQFSDQDVEEVSDSDWEDHVPVKSDKLSKDAHRLFPVGPAAKKDTKDTDKRRDRRKSSSTAELVESTRPKARESPKKKHRELPKELPKGPASSNSNNPLMSRIDSKWKAAPLQSKYAEPVQSKHADPKPSHKHQPLPKHKDRPRSDRAKKEPPLDPSFIQKQNALEFEKSLDKLKLESQTGNWADDLDWY